MDQFPKSQESNMSERVKAKTMKRRNIKGLELSAAPVATAPSPSAGDAQIPGAIGNNGRADTLEIGVEFKLDLRSEDLVVVKELGAGNGGTVSKVFHPATKVIMAKKVIHVEAKKEVRRKQIVRELHIMHDCNSPYIVSFYGAFLNNAGDVIMCMEYMDCGSLDRISKDFGPVRIDVLGKIAEAVLGGLTYLYNVHRIMHRDIKPSNVLVNTRGYIKLCDFGVSGELVNSIANTFVGTSTYMAPERIQGAQYSVKSDVWSMGLTLMELAIGRFPFDSSDEAAGDRANAGPTGILDLLQQIVHEPAPKLPKSDAFPKILEDMIARCLLKNPDERPTPQELYDKDSFIKAARRTPVDLEGWAISMMEKNNRHSHLALQPPAHSKSLLRSSDDSASSKETLAPKTPKTPTSGEIFIAGDVKPPPPPPPPPVPPMPASGTEDDGTARRQYNPHPGYPVRTSSASAVPVLRSAKTPTVALSPPSIPGTRASPGATSHFTTAATTTTATTTTTTLPMRPAPPPAGPLPPAPSRVVPRKTSSYHGPEQYDVVGDVRREVPIGLQFSNSDGQSRY